MSKKLTPKLIIAIDGPAASGKGSLAKKLAKMLDYNFLDTGALYRRVALKALEQNIDLTDEPAIIATAKQLEAELSDEYDDSALRSDNVGSTASKIAQIQAVRDILINFQRDFAKNAEKGAVLDGRDIGTVICPDADIKLFITASVEKRADRRHKELQSRGIDVKKPSVLVEMQERDDRDKARLDAHLNSDHDNFKIYTSDMTPGEVLDEALKIINSHS